MFRPQVALGLGALLLALGFAVGVEPVSTSVQHQSYECGSVIGESWLTPGTASASTGTVDAPQDPRLADRVQVQCHTALVRTRWLTWAGLGLGGLAVLLGWTALREQRNGDGLGSDAVAPTLTR